MARAAICGEASGLGWDYLHFIFEYGRTASLDTLIGKAVHMGLVEKDFERCMVSEETRIRLDSDIAFAASIGVRGTPVFLVDGRKVEGGRPVEMVQAMLQSVRQADGTR
jgi:predicted DsbA family dithiol-disulfide isomerase